MSGRTVAERSDEEELPSFEDFFASQYECLFRAMWLLTGSKAEGEDLAQEAMAGLGITHRRGGYRDPESQAFIESWFGKLKRREVWVNEYETPEQARLAIGRYIDRYHDRPHSGLGYRTPNEVAASWQEAQSAKIAAV